MIHPSLTKLTDEGAEGCTGSRARTALGSCAFCPTKTSSLDDVRHLRHFELHGEASNTRLRGLDPKR